MPRDILESIRTLDDTHLRLLACACAEHVLPIFETGAPGDPRPRHAIETARRFAVGDARADALHAARGEAEGAAWHASLSKGANPEHEADAAPSAAACAEACCIVSARESCLATLETSIEVVEIAAVGLDDASVLWGSGRGFEVLDAATASAVRETRDALWSWQRSAIARLRQP